MRNKLNMNYKKLSVSAILLTISGVNVYLPDVGNLFDVWRFAFSVCLFTIGILVLIDTIHDADF